MFPGVSQRERMGMSKASQICMNRAALSAPVAVHRAGEMDGVVRDEPDRTPLDADEGGHHSGPELSPELEDGALVGEDLDDAMHVVDTQPVLGNDVAQAPLIAHVQSSTAPWK